MCGGFIGDLIDAATDNFVEIIVVAAVAAIFAPAGAALSSALLAGGSVLVSAALAPSLDIPDLSDATQVTQGRNVSIRQTVAPQRVVYGKVRAGGIFAHSNTTGSNEYLHTFVIFACHEIDSFTDIILSDNQLAVGSTLTNVFSNDSDGQPRYGVSSGNAYYSSEDSESSIRISLRTGASNQTANPTAVSDLSEWTSNHRLRGLAYAYMRFRFDADIYSSGVPSISAIMKGKPVFSVVQNGTGWTQNAKEKGRNPALCIRDFLTDTKYGLGIATAEINDSTTTAGGFGYAETRCEDTINGKARYLCDGVFDTALSPKGILDNLLSSCSGKLIYQNGKFNLYVGFYTAPTITLTEDDIIGETIIQTKLGRKDIFNTVKATYYNKDEKFVSTEITPISSTKFKNEDDGEEIVANLSFTMVSETTKVNELAAIELLKARQQITVSLTTSLSKGFQLQAGDFVNLTLDRMGFSSKVFEIIEWSFTTPNSSESPLACNLVLRETDTTVYSNSVLSNISTSIEATDPAADTSLTSSVVAPTNLTLSSPAAGQIKAVWECTDDPSQFVIEYKLQSAGSYTQDTFMKGSFRQFTMKHISAGAYDVRVFARNSAGTESTKISGQVTVS